MAEFKPVYKCSICGNMAELIHAGGGTLVCCGQQMVLLDANTVEASQEKHIPVIETTTDGIMVKVGSVPHPMEGKHFIEWIEVIADGKTQRAYLSPGQAPEASFVTTAQSFEVRAYCNLHGLWKA
ncbi:desulfoferrodoxin [Candidatus Wirthbacteria bacterium CG2_30_54_11]|uniref:Desulfoferrodoxin n=1 Tax=Candidatus Wirthbacteria bacterium CG2_30_54_11 TaxID=1817892 RepID=A0A1J5IKX5_9BACT|nr:MAG: desulfoferrodoxin [Candidatus Wirthbacteria bacterium CG2_30_54_11]